MRRRSKLLEESLRQYGKPDQILTDRGTQFYPARGASQISESIAVETVSSIVTSIRRPSTIGKIEAFHEACAYEPWIYLTHKGFVNHWN